MISIKVSFVLQLVDDFDGKSLTNAGVSFYEGERVLKPIRKSDGMYVFTDEFREISTIRIECVGYHDKEITLDLNKIDRINPLVVVRLYGRPGGSFAYRYDLCCGTMKVKKGIELPLEVYATKKKQLNLFFKAYREEDGKKIITFQGFCMEPLIGLTFALGEGKETTLFYIKEKIGSNEYCICPIEKESVQIKTGSALFRIYRSVTDKNGNYSIPVDEGVELLEEISISPSSLP